MNCYAKTRKGHHCELPAGHADPFHKCGEERWRYLPIDAHVAALEGQRIDDLHMQLTAAQARIMSLEAEIMRLTSY